MPVFTDPLTILNSSDFSDGLHPEAKGTPLVSGRVALSNEARAEIEALIQGKDKMNSVSFQGNQVHVFELLHILHSDKRGKENRKNAA